MTEERSSPSVFSNLLRLVLVRTNFPENIGMAARASANFGHAGIFLASPRRWNLEKAMVTATSQGTPLLDSVTVCPSLAEAVAPCQLVIATTARIGGMRQQMRTPREAAAEAVERILSGENVAIVFGPEDKGLSNEDLLLCGRLVRIPTDGKDSSLNLAQAVLIMLYECFLAMPGTAVIDRGHGLSRRISSSERETLFSALKNALVSLDALPKDNPDYFFLPLARLFDRAGLRRHEFDIFMGICRQITRLTTAAFKNRI